jgi:hypothetical protein
VLFCFGWDHRLARNAGELGHRSKLSLGFAGPSRTAKVACFKVRTIIPIIPRYPKIIPVEQQGISASVGALFLILNFASLFLRLFELFDTFPLIIKMVPTDHYLLNHQSNTSTATFCRAHYYGRHNNNNDNKFDGE